MVDFGDEISGFPSPCEERNGRYQVTRHNLIMIRGAYRWDRSKRICTVDSLPGPSTILTHFGANSAPVSPIDHRKTQPNIC